MWVKSWVRRLRRVPSVSYTHLDVYKRQLLLCVIGVGVYLTVTMLFKINTLEVAVDGEAVSYTHLAEMGVMINIGRGGERARLERENLRALREQREKEKSNNTIRLDPNMGY